MCCHVITVVPHITLSIQNRKKRSAGIKAGLAAESANNRRIGARTSSCYSVGTPADWVIGVVTHGMCHLFLGGHIGGFPCAHCAS